MSELTELCAELEHLAAQLGRSVEQLRTMARTLEREAESLRGQVTGTSGPVGRVGQAAVDALVGAARASEQSAQDLAAAATAGLEYARRNASGGGAPSAGSGRVAGPQATSDFVDIDAAGAAPQPAADAAMGPYLTFGQPLPLDAATISTSRSRQGARGDCGAVAACDGLRRYDPRAAAAVVTAEPDGLYAVHLHPAAGTGAETIRLSASAPERAAKSFYPTTGGQSADWSWVTMVEKALAERKGSYDALDGLGPAEVLTALTGRAFGYSPPPRLETIATLLQHSPVIAGSKADLGPAPFGNGPSKRRADPEVIVPNHWYSVVTVAELVGPGGSSYEIILENPWGESSAQGSAYLHLDEATFFNSFDVTSYEGANGGPW